MNKKEFPDEGELVVGTIIKVQNYGAFVSLDEYPSREGFIHIAEVATGWVKRIRNHIKEKQKIVCKVMNVDSSKNHVDLSLKRVNEHQKRDKIQEWKNSQKSTRLLQMVAKKIGKTVEECYSEFASQLISKYGSLYVAFEEFAYDSDAVKKDGFSGYWFEEFEKIAKENITIPFVEISGYLEVNSWIPDGIKYIRNSLSEAEHSEYDDVEITIKYIGAPQYIINVKAPDYKIAEGELKKSIEKIKENLKNHNGTCEFHRKADE